MNRALLAVTIVAITLLGLVPSYGPTAEANGSAPAYPNASGSPRTFTWISCVTPELAAWAKNLSFTDVVVCNSSTYGYECLEAENITYWFCVSCYGFRGRDVTSVANAEEAILSYAQSSPNGHVYFDDLQYILGAYGVAYCNNFLNAIRNLEQDGYQFGIDAYLAYGYTYYESFGLLNLTDLDIDIYQYPSESYAAIVLPVLKANAQSIGLCVWAYGCDGCCGLRALPWNLMTSDYLDLVYGQAETYCASRVHVWDGSSPTSGKPCMDNACLYSYPQWWDKVRAENLKFLESTK
jgi:hypothetical protein